MSFLTGGRVTIAKLQYSKLVASRNAWRSKATQRAETIKALNNAIKH